MSFSNALPTTSISAPDFIVCFAFSILSIPPPTSNGIVYILFRLLIKLVFMFFVAPLPASK